MFEYYYILFFSILRWYTLEHSYCLEVQSYQCLVFWRIMEANPQHILRLPRYSCTDKHKKHTQALVRRAPVCSPANAPDRLE
jgi:hypothetical protein